MKEREINLTNKDGTGSTEENVSFEVNKSKNKKEMGSDCEDQESLVIRSTRETNSLQPKAIDTIINSIGYTGYHFKLILCCGLLYFSEGNQLFSLNMLMPLMKNVFIQNSDFTKTFLVSALFFGYIIGSSISGILTKNYGRRASLNSFLFFYCVLAITIGMIENIYYMAFCRLAIGMCLGITCPQFINNLSEFLPMENKEIVILSMYIFYRCGILYFIICFKLLEPHKYINHWKDSFLLSSIPVILITILSNIIFKDSPKLLLNKKELYKAVDAIYELSSEKHYSQGYEIDEIHINRMKQEFAAFEHERNINYKMEFSYKILFGSQFRYLIILCCVIFLCASVVNVIFIYSLPMMIAHKSDLFKDPSNFNNLQNDMAKEILITQIVTIPAIILSAMLCKVVGRKTTIMLGFSMCFISTFIPCFTNQGLIASSAFVNFFIIFAQCTIKVYVIEAFPTKLRDYALSFCLCMSKIGDCMVPLLCNISFTFFSFGPIALSNIVCLSGLIATISLPFDTLGSHLE